MITIKNVRTLSGPLQEQTFLGEGNDVIDGQNRLLMLPAWIDTDISLGMVNGKSDKEWQKISHDILETGATTIIDNSGVAPGTVKRFQDHLNTLFRGANITLRLHNILDGGDPSISESIGKNKSYAAAIKVPLELLEEAAEVPVSDADNLFQIAAQENVILIVSLLSYPNKQAALKAMTTALSLAEKYKTEVTFQQVRTKAELALIREAKTREMLIFAEVAYPHLFFSEEDLERKQFFLENTFLPTEEDQNALWAAIQDGTIDLLGSSNHLLPSGNLLPEGKLMLPFMLDACRHEKLSYEQLVGLIRINAERIYRLTPTKDVVLVDMETTHPINNKLDTNTSLLSLWTERPLAGWPAYVITQGKLYKFTV